MNFKSVGLIASIATVMTFSPADASTFTFSFDNTVSAPSFVPGTVTGLIFGLNEDGSGQTPTGYEILTSPAAIGFTNFFIPVEQGTFDVSGGTIVAANNVFVEDPSSYILELNYFNGVPAHNNVLVNVTSGFASGNQGSFAGATYSEVAAVPEPSTWAMMILGFAGISAMTYRRRKSDARCLI